MSMKQRPRKSVVTTILPGYSAPTWPMWADVFPSSATGHGNPFSTNRYSSRVCTLMSTERERSHRQGIHGLQWTGLL